MGGVRWNVKRVLVSNWVRDPVVGEGMCSECSSCAAAVPTLKECAEQVKWSGAIRAKDVEGSLFVA